MFFLTLLANWAFNRLKEPSTYAGIGAVVAGASPVMPTDMTGSIQSIAMGVCGLLAIVMRERKG